MEMSWSWLIWVSVIVAIIMGNWSKGQRARARGGGPRVEALEKKIEELESALVSANMEIKELEDKQNYLMRLLEDKT